MTYLKEWIITTVVVVGLMTIGAVVVITAARNHAASVPCEAPEGVQQGWQPPPLELCPEDMKLWDCIRNAAYRSDI